jgi:hypothetical protein
MIKETKVNLKEEEKTVRFQLWKVQNRTFGLVDGGPI